MSAYRPKIKNSVSVAAIIGFVVLALYFMFFGNLAEIGGVIGKTSIPLYALAFICVIGGITFNALTWYKILGKLSVKTTFRRVFSLSWVGIFVDAIIPGGWTGDIFKGYLLSKDKEVDGPKTAASIIVKNVFETFLSLGALIVGVILLALNFSLNSQVILAVGITMTLLSLPAILILYLSLNAATSERVLRLVRKLVVIIKGKHDNSSDMEMKLKASLIDFHEGMMMLKTNPKEMLQPLVFQAIAWAFDILTLFIIFASIGYIVSPDKIIITNTIAVNLQVQGFALAGVAPVLTSTLYNSLGIETLVSMSSSLLTLFPMFWFKVIIAFFAFQVIVFNRAIPFFTEKSANLSPNQPILQ